MTDHIVRKTLDFGLGLAMYSKDKIEALVEEMVSKGEVARKDARKLADELVKKGEDSRVELRALVSDEVRSALKTLGLSKDDAPFDQERLDRLVEEKVEQALRRHEQNGQEPTEITSENG